MPLARRRESRHGSQRAAAHQQAARGGGQADHFGQPADHQPFDVQGSVVATRAARVGRAREQVEQQCDPIRGRVHPRVKPRVTVPEREAEDVTLDLVEDLLDPGPLLRPLLAAPPVGQFLGNRREHRPFRQPNDMVSSQSRDTVRGRPQRRFIPRPAAGQTLWLIHGVSTAGRPRARS
jgi:hypothetical protein